MKKMRCGKAFCRRDADYIVLGMPMCWVCWSRQCIADDKEWESLQKKVNQEVEKCQK